MENPKGCGVSATGVVKQVLRCARDDSGGVSADYADSAERGGRAKAHGTESVPWLPKQHQVFCCAQDAVATTVITHTCSHVWGTRHPHPHPTLALTLTRSPVSSLSPVRETKKAGDYNRTGL